ncbi:MAG: PQQ-binding-like beta-propeller repeat protein [Planctomycetes bacterium]|nr:PQQ-binding-like beta-propeller repeat protein [Planctomycetota bacterium]
MAGVIFLLSLDIVFATDRRFIWSATVCDKHDATTSCKADGATLAPLFVKSTLVCTCPHGKTVAVNYMTGKRIWESPIDRSSLEIGIDRKQGTSNQVRSALIGRSFVAYYERDNTRLSAFDVNLSGRLIWQRTVESTLSSDDFLFGRVGRNELELLSVFRDYIEHRTLDGASGALLSSFKLPLNGIRDAESQEALGSIASTTAARRDNIVLVTRGSLYSVDVRTRHYDWIRRLPMDFGAPRKICVLDESLAVVSATQCMVLSAETGLQKWAVRGVDYCHSISTGSSVVLYRDGRIESFDGLTGQAVWSVEYDTKSISGASCIHGNVIVIPTGERTLVFLSKSTGEVVHTLQFQSDVGSVFSVNRDVISFDGCHVKKLEFNERNTQTTFRVTTPPLTVGGYTVRARVIVAGEMVSPSSGGEASP